MGYKDETDHRKEANGKLQQKKEEEQVCPKAGSLGLLSKLFNIPPTSITPSFVFVIHLYLR